MFCTDYIGRSLPPILGRVGLYNTSSSSHLKQTQPNPTQQKSPRRTSARARLKRQKRNKSHRPRHKVGRSVVRTHDHLGQRPPDGHRVCVLAPVPLGDRDLEVNPRDDYVIVWAVRMTDMAGFLLDLTADEPLPRENDEPFPPLDRAERVLFRSRSTISSRG